MRDLGPGALALAVYADEDDRPLQACQQGFEGVACVDDAARAVVVLDDLAIRTASPLLHQWARGLVDFIISAQRSDGTFVNFTVDWRGGFNEVGPTSRAGGLFWHARALAALGRASRDGGIAAEAYARAREAIADDGVPPDVRALHILEAIDARARGQETRPELERWCEELVGCRRGDLLLDSAGADPHLWGHVQEAALARAGMLLGRGDLIDIASRSAHGFIIPAVESGFAGERVQPYDVTSAVTVLDALWAATHEKRYALLAHRARSWFDTRDAGGRLVYDRTRGRVADCVTRGMVNPRSGAEANIVGAEALLDEVANDFCSRPALAGELAELLCLSIAA